MPYPCIKLRKDQRFTAYCIMMFELQDYDPDNYDLSDGLCFAFRHLFNLVDSSGGYHNIIREFFPELQKKKPKKIKEVGLWFHPNNRSLYGRDKRISILKKCIKETF